MNPQTVQDSRSEKKTDLAKSKQHFNNKPLSPQQAIHELDPNMVIGEVDENGIKWFNPAVEPFEVSGFNWFAEDKLYQRFPEQLDLPLRDRVKELGMCSAGGQIRFCSDSKRIQIKAKLKNTRGAMDHMPSSGEGGFDLYLGEPGSERYYSTARAAAGVDQFEYELFNATAAKMRSYTINLPLYNGVEKIQIGLDANSMTEKPASRPGETLVFYGTSILQGGCASRPGMCYTTQISRKLGRKVLNFGFSGNGKGEVEVAKYLSRISSPALYFIDYQANVTPEILENTLPEFIATLRAAHPEIPIVIKSRIKYAKEYFIEEEGISTEIYTNRIAGRGFMREFVNKRQQAGDENIYFMEGESILGDDYHECTVDGIHPTDLGFYRMAEAVTEYIKDLI